MYEYQSNVPLPSSEDRDVYGGQTKAKTKKFRLVKMVKGGYYFIQERVKSQWVDTDCPALTNEVEAFIEFGRCLEADLCNAEES